MRLALEVVGSGGVVPIATAAAMIYLVSRFASITTARRYAYVAALAGAFCTGYVLLPSWAALLPDRYWHWLPYLGVLAALAAAIGRVEGIRLPERWLLYLLAAGAAAWLLVPTWADLQPVRLRYVFLFAAYVLLLAVLLDPLPARIKGSLFLASLAAVAAASAIGLAATVSLKFGQVGSVAAAGLTGCWIAAAWTRPPAAGQGLPLVYAVIVGGTVFASHLQPDPPLSPLLAIPVAPLALWAAAIGPVARRGGLVTWLVGLGAVTVWTAAALIWVWVAAP